MRSASAVRTYPLLGGTVFFALYPPREVAEAVGDLTDRMFATGELTGLRTRREWYHVSLNNLGRDPPFSSRLISRACEAASQVRARSFVVAFNLVISFKGSRSKARVLAGDEGDIGVILLHGAIHEALAHAGLTRRPERKLRPHLTLSWEDQLLPEKVIEPVTWRVQDFYLVHSVPGEGHQVLGRWALQGADPT